MSGSGTDPIAGSSNKGPFGDLNRSTIQVNMQKKLINKQHELGCGGSSRYIKNARMFFKIIVTTPVNGEPL